MQVAEIEDAFGDFTAAEQHDDVGDELLYLLDRVVRRVVDALLKLLLALGERLDLEVVPLQQRGHLVCAGEVGRVRVG
ncbi:hypothetical protein [Mycobacterium avium]